MKKSIADLQFAKYLESIGMRQANSTSTEPGNMIRTQLGRRTKVIHDVGIGVNLVLKSDLVVCV